MHGQQLEYQTELLLHTLGDSVLKVYNRFHFLSPEEQQTPEEILKVFNRYVVGENNVTYEQFVFHMRKQEESESIEAFMTALRMLIKI